MEHETIRLSNSMVKLLSSTELDHKFSTNIYLEHNNNVSASQAAVLWDFQVEEWSGMRYHFIKDAYDEFNLQSMKFHAWCYHNMSGIIYPLKNQSNPNEWFAGNFILELIS